MFDQLDDENFLLFAAAHYYNPRCSDVEDFYEDLYRIKYIKRLINRYIETDKLSERLILNHIIIFFNSFNIKPSLRILEYKIDSKGWTILKPFLIKLNYISEGDYPHIESDKTVEDALRKI